MLKLLMHILFKYNTNTIQSIYTCLFFCFFLYRINVKAVKPIWPREGLWDIKIGREKIRKNSWNVFLKMRQFELLKA